MTKIVLILKSSFIHSFDFPNSIHPWITTSPPSPQEAAILTNTFPVCCRAAKQVKPPHMLCVNFSSFFYFFFTLFFYFVFVLFLLIFVSVLIFCSLLHVSESIWVGWLWILVLVLEKFPRWFYVL